MDEPPRRVGRHRRDEVTSPARWVPSDEGPEATQPLPEQPIWPPPRRLRSRHLAAGWHPWISDEALFALVVWGCPFVFTLFLFSRTGSWDWALSIESIKHAVVVVFRVIVALIVLAGVVVASRRGKRRR